MPRFDSQLWQLASVTMFDYVDPYHVQLYAEIGTEEHAVMAVDDLEFVEGGCPDLGHCGFEVDDCGWSNLREADNFDWIRYDSRRGVESYLNIAIS